MDMTKVGWPFPPMEFEPELAKTALLIIDMQYCDAHPDYGLGKAIEACRPGAGAYYFDRLKKTTIPNIQRFLKFFRDNKLRVVHLTIGRWAEDGSDITRVYKWKDAFRSRVSGTKSAGLPLVGSFEHQILEEVKPLPGELVVNKNTSGAFSGSNLDTVLNNMGVEYLVATGVVTNGCVESTVRAAVDRGFFTILVDDACAAHSPAAHEATLKTFRHYSGMVKTTDETVRILSRNLPKVAARA